MSVKVNYSNLFGLFIGFCFLSMSIIITIKSFENDSNIIAILFAIIMFYSLSYLFISTALCRIQYDKFQNKRNVLINYDKKEITIKNSINEKTLIHLTEEEVKKLNVYYSYNSNPLSPDLGYSEIIFKNGNSILLTQEEISQTEILAMFGESKLKNESIKFFHKLK